MTKKLINEILFTYDKWLYGNGKQYEFTFGNLKEIYMWLTDKELAKKEFKILQKEYFSKKIELPKAKNKNSMITIPKQEGVKNTITVSRPILLDKN